MDWIKGLKERVVKNDLKVFDLAIGRIKLSLLKWVRLGGAGKG